MLLERATFHARLHHHDISTLIEIGWCLRVVSVVCNLVQIN